MGKVRNEDIGTATVEAMVEVGEKLHDQEKNPIATAKTQVRLHGSREALEKAKKKRKEREAQQQQLSAMEQQRQLENTVEKLQIDDEDKLLDL